jgi:hypothetical protein
MVILSSSERAQRTEGWYRRHLQGQKIHKERIQQKNWKLSLRQASLIHSDPEDECDIFLRNVELSPNFLTLHNYHLENLESIKIRTDIYIYRCRSQPPRSLRHEPSSPARTLGSWVRIPLKAWMSVYVYSVFILSCVGSGLVAGWFPVKGVLPTA